MKPQDVSQTLKAGGLVPHNAKLGKDEPVDRVAARAYRHPVLPGRVVVRLTAESVAAGDELEMATLGFGPGEERGTVGKERKRPLGFPGWALVNDPKNARYALDVVKEFKKHARKAKSKPGHARDGIEAIAAKLGKTVPQFLPSFYEEAGRAFIEHGAPSFAAAMFGKARAAEAVHALEVDEQHRVDGFLEFALAGAVTTKALTEYAKELAEHHAPAVAYGHFRQLCLQRTLGGMPPWAGMAKDLRRLAKAAKLDPDEEDAKLVAEIIESPALAKAAGELWRAYEAPITALGRRSAGVRGALLNLFPTGSSYSAELDDTWLQLIEASGAIEGLVGDAPEEARPSGGRAAWFNKLTMHLSRSWKETRLGGQAFELLRKMAPALARDGAPIACVGRWNRFDLDLAELALELEVPVVPSADARIDLKTWALGASAADRGRDPVRAAAHPVIGPLLAAAVAHEIGSEPFDSMSRGKAGFLAAKRRWLEGLLGSAEDGALPALDDALGVIAAKVTAETFAELADLHPRFAALDAARALARTLQIGLLDEFGWPALEDAAHELNPDGKAELALYGGLPAVVLANKTRAIAVGPTGRLGVHDLVIPPRHELVSIRYIGGQFLVALQASWQLYGYWSAAPQDRFQSDVSTWHVPEVAARVAVLADGAWQEGARLIRAGDRVVPQAGLMSHDGATAWIADHRELRHKLREVSASGEPGRVSWPAWLEAGLAPEWYVDAMQSYVLPAPDGLARSPLGLSDGRLGARVAYQGTNQHHKTARRVTTIAGRTWTGPALPAGIEIAELVELPSGETRPLQEETGWRVAMTTSLWNTEGTVRGARFGPKDARTWRGSVAPYPDCLWHALTPRDAAGSRRLRAITDGDARKLIDAVDALGVTTELADLVPVDVVARQLREVTHERLRRGIAGVVALAAQLERRRAELAGARAPGKAIARGPSVTGPDDEAIQQALGGWIDPAYDNGSALLQIAACGELFRGSDHRDRAVPDAPGSRVDWFSLAVAPGALAFLATAIGISAEHRRTIAALLSVMARELPDPAKLRVASGVRTDAAEPGTNAQLTLSWHAGNAYAIRRQAWNKDVRVLEYAPEGKFKPPPEIALGQWRRGVAPVSEDVVAAVRTSAGLPPEVRASSSAAPASAAAGPGGVIGRVLRFFRRDRSPAPEASAVSSAAPTGEAPSRAVPAPPSEIESSSAETWLADAETLAAEAGLTPSEAVYLAAGCPGAGTRTNNFLDKELREQLGLKATQAAVARDALAAIPRGQRLAALDDSISLGGAG
ncbi:MAG TPA: hypothetical protein VLM79_00460, partial [Kofleriaceae bacterium]|nr:hypothetical protein [Kofleriaceae bacterium]